MDDVAVDGSGVQVVESALVSVTEPKRPTKQLRSPVRTAKVSRRHDCRSVLAESAPDRLAPNVRDRASCPFDEGEITRGVVMVRPFLEDHVLERAENGELPIEW